VPLANPNAEDESESPSVISPFAQTTSTVQAPNSGRATPWALWIVSTLLLLVVAGVIGYFTYQYVEDPYRTLEEFPVDKFMSGDYRALTGAKFKADMKVSADLGSSDVGRLMVFTVANDTRPLPVLIPTRLSGIYFTKGQNYRASLEVGQGGLIYADTCEKE
jgi:hypothetical protein